VKPVYNCTCPEVGVTHDHNYAQRCYQPSEHEPGMILCVEPSHWGPHDGHVPA